ncbi:hypothetical protein [Polymorphospora rubra]|uniref:Lipoprotein n=1 Tax=Polymorphospora rubra TaxID=338584 RepID=A0A810N9P0_9ACTN|nr:hypothetical protein [Polymorphospora rubra]BCJ69957.1 hypothetical protein Prubr_69780 [Polymorphospora rubra]
MTIYRRIRAAATLSVLLLTAAACAQGGNDPAGPDPGPVSLESDVAAIRVDYTGGFSTPAMLASRIPLIAVYGDGRVFTQGPQVMIYPGPALPNLQVQTISESDVDALVERALAAGVGEAKDFGQPPVADAASTRITVVTSDGEKVLEVYALEETPEDGAGLTADQVSARAKVKEFVASLTDLSGTLGAGATGQPTAYVPTAVAAIAEPWVAGDPALPAPPEVAWPGPALPGEPLGPGLDVGCVSAAGDAAAKVLSAAATATSATPWTSEGKTWTVHLRPLLPDEADCADLLAG